MPERETEDEELLRLARESGAFPRIREERASQALARILASGESAAAGASESGPGWRRWVLIAGMPAAAAAALAIYLVATRPEPLGRFTIQSAAPQQAGTAPEEAGATREDLALFLDRALGPALAPLGPLSTGQPAVRADLPDGHPALRWIEAGILPGEAGKFSPGMAITRAELAMALYQAEVRLTGVEPRGSDSQRYEDVPPDHFAFRASAALTPEVVPPRAGTTFGVADPVSRSAVEEAVRTLAARLGGGEARGASRDPSSTR